MSDPKPTHRSPDWYEGFIQALHLNGHTTKVLMELVEDYRNLDKRTGDFR